MAYKHKGAIYYFNSLVLDPKMFVFIHWWIKCISLVVFFSFSRHWNMTWVRNQAALIDVYSYKFEFEGIPYKKNDLFQSFSQHFSTSGIRWLNCFTLTPDDDVWSRLTFSPCWTCKPSFPQRKPEPSRHWSKSRQIVGKRSELRVCSLPLNQHDVVSRL